MTDKMRDEFEAAFREKFGFGRLTASANADAHNMLKAAEWAWRASRESLVVESPDDFTSDGNPKARITIEHHREIVTLWVKSIEAAGVKVKP